MYNPESYWDSVASKIRLRNKENVIAGDDEPFYRYKRKMFLKLFHQITFADKSVLEVGCGPGGNLLEVLKHSPKRLEAVDISEEMISLAETNTSGKVPITKIDGGKFPFADKEFDISFTSTVLQHIPTEEDLQRTITEICRVTNSEVYVFERIENVIKGHSSNIGRPVAYYSDLFFAQGFRLRNTTFLNLPASYYVSGAFRKLFQRKGTEEGAPFSKLGAALQQLALPITSLIDKLWKQKRELAKLHFIREL